MGHRAVLQGHKAEPADQNLCGHERERRQITDIRCPDILSAFTAHREDYRKENARLLEFCGEDKDVPLFLPYPGLCLQHRWPRGEKGATADQNRFRCGGGLIFGHHLILEPENGVGRVFLHIFKNFRMAMFSFVMYANF